MRPRRRVKNGQKYPNVMLSEKDKASFFSPTEVWCLPTPSVIKREEREFVVDSAASMHMLEKCKQRDEATVYVKELDFLLVTVKLREDTPAVLSLGKLSEDSGYSYEWTSGQRNHNSSKMADEYFAARRTTHRSLSLVYRLVFPGQLHIHLVQDSVLSTSRPATTRSESTSRSARRDLSLEPTETKTQIKTKNTESARREPDLFEELTRNLVDEQVPEHRDAPTSSFRESASESLRKVSFPKDRNCDILHEDQAKITRGPCRKRTGASTLRPENFGDVMTADHKVVSEGRES